jgi:NAD(P)-dependent dehydrogenase (short-subunit alcohol dehydrogenase family)
MTKSKIALVTGGSRGLGKDMALQLAHKGFDVVITYQTKSELAQEVVNEIKAIGKKAFALPLDVAIADSFDAFVTNLSATLKNEFQAEHIFALVNNAGIGNYASFAETSMEQFDSMVNIHLKAPFFLAQKLLTTIEDGGSIVNISSGLARFSYNGYAAYAIPKAAVESLSRYQALELGPRRIRVNTVAPGAIETDFGGGAVRDNADVNAMFAGITSLGRVGLPHDIGSVVAFLCSEDAKWINAQRIEVSGGFHI